jgi:RNA polymerase sigma factor (sigma-70 family)
VAIAARAPDGNAESEHTEALYREHGDAVSALCHSLLRDRGEAEDATQQVFLSAHRALLNGTEPREPLAWLLAVARNECYARYRRRAATPVPTGEAPDVATADASVHVLRAGELTRLWDEVERLPCAQREAFLLREIRGLSYAQLAGELSVSAQSVRSLLLRARTRLRHRLGDIAAGVGGAQWVQALLRIAGSGDGPSPVPAAAKAAAVGLGALALAGGGSVPRAVHDSSAPRPHAAAHHRREARSRPVAAPAAAPAPVAREDRSLQHSHIRHERSRGSGSHGGSDDTVVSALGSAADSRDGGSTSVSPSGSDDGGGSSSSGPGETTTATAASTSSGESSSGGSPSVSTTPTTSSGSDSSGPDGSGSSASDGSITSGSSGSGSGHDGSGGGGD